MPLRLPSFVRVDPYLVALVLVVVFAAVCPAAGLWASVIRFGVSASIAGLFFSYGVRLATAQVVEALLNWRPQALVFATTYITFPLLGLFWTWLFERTGMVDSTLSLGLLFLTILPSTVQSSIAFTSIAKGNVGAALCAASVSNLAGVVLVPLLVSMLFDGGILEPGVSGATSGGAEVDSHAGSAVKDIALQILLPFLLGQVARPWLSDWFQRHKLATVLFDRGSILLVVYSAFSAGMVAGVWSRIGATSLVGVLLFDLALLASVMAFTLLISRALGFVRADEIAILFCGSKKSMASGIPMANVLFSAQLVSVIVIPLMVFHQLQLFVCAVIAQRYARANTGPHYGK